MAEQLGQAVLVVILTAGSIDLGISFLWRALREVGEEGASRD